MTRADPVAVLGLGFMGGSLARDLAAAGSRLLGYDADPDRARQGVAEGVLDAILTDSLSGIGEAELIVLATPVDAARGLLARLAPLVADDVVITDLGSTKAEIVADASRLGLGPRFIGSHPMAGADRSGWEASRTGLFRGAPVHLCPTSTTSPATIARVERLWQEVGASCGMIDAHAHDELMAWVSHLPQVASSAVAAALAGAGQRPERLGSGGRDVTRLAASSPEMWTAICLSNDVALGRALEALSHGIADFQAALRRRDADALHDFFASGRAWLGEHRRPA